MNMKIGNQKTVQKMDGENEEKTVVETLDIEIPKKVMERFDEYCEKNGVSGKQKEQMLVKLKEIVKKTSFEPGEAVGVITAQSISEPATQMTMRSYTMASQAGRMAKVTLGLPRMVEIFDARKSFQKSMIIYLKSEHDNKQKAANFAEKIKEKTVEDFVDKSSIDLLEMRIEFDMKGEIDRDLFKKNLEKLDKTAVASFREDKIFIKPDKSDIKDLRNLKNKILKIHISGIKGIEETTVVMENDRWLVQTSGTNLLEIMKLPETDLHRTTTNDIYEIADVLGIEAARNAILRESKKTLDDQGLDVDIRHLMIVADIMTSDGAVSSVGRYGVSGQKASPLARANFEETIKHLTMASFHGERDRLNGIVENVMLGRVAPIGTGLVNLVVDPAKLKKGVKSD